MRTRLQALLSQRPVAASVIILVMDIILSLAITSIVKVMAPNDGNEFATLCALTVITLGLMTLLGWWTVSGFNRSSAWHNLGLLVLPAAVIIIPPFLGGIKPIEPSSFAYLVFAYGLVGLREEALWRGIVLHILKPLGPTRATLLAGVLFGLSHLANLAVRGNPMIVFAQVLGAVCDGIGFGVIRLRTNTIWFVIILHAIHDLLLQYTRLPAIPLDVVQVTVLIIYGLYLLRTRPAAGVEQALA